MDNIRRPAHRSIRVKGSAVPSILNVPDCNGFNSLESGKYKLFNKDTPQKERV